MPGCLGGTLLAVSRTDLGLDARERVVTMAVPIGESTADAAGRLAIVRRILDETRQLPGVVAAGIGGALPPSAGGVVFTIRVTTSEGTVNATRAFDLVPVTDGYFDALGARIVTGRVFTQADTLSSDPTCVMSEAALKHLALVTGTAIDRTLNLSLPTASGTRVKPRIVGVVHDIRYRASTHRPTAACTCHGSRNSTAIGVPRRAHNGRPRGVAAPVDADRA